MIGLLGVENDGMTIVSPNGEHTLKLPSKRLASFIQRMQHRFASGRPVKGVPVTYNNAPPKYPQQSAEGEGNG